MRDRQIEERALALIGRAQCVQLATVDERGFPVVKALLPPLAREGIKKLVFSTNTSSRKMRRIASNAKACIYALDSETYEGLALVGLVEVLDDPVARERYWRPGFEEYYPGGPDDPDYALLAFTAIEASYYNDLNDTVWAL